MIRSRPTPGHHIHCLVSVRPMPLQLLPKTQQFSYNQILTSSLIFHTQTDFFQVKCGTQETGETQLLPSVVSRFFLRSVFVSIC